MSLSKETILERLRRVKGPDLEGNIVDLGLVSEVLVKDGRVSFSITVPVHRAAELEGLRQAADKVVREMDGVTGVAAVLTAERSGGGNGGARAPGARQAPESARVQQARARTGVGAAAGPAAQAGPPPGAAPGAAPGGRPRTLQIAQRFGYYEPSFVAERTKDRDFRVELAKRHHVGRVEQRPRSTGAGITESPDRQTVTGRDSHLDRMFDAALATYTLDEAYGALDRSRWIVSEAKRKGKEEKQLRVSGALDVRIQGRINRQHQLSLCFLKPCNRAVVHPEPFAVPERMAIALLHRRTRR